MIFTLSNKHHCARYEIYHNIYPFDVIDVNTFLYNIDQSLNFF